MYLNKYFKNILEYLEVRDYINVCISKDFIPSYAIVELNK